jgi:competence protein ComGC
MTTIKKVIVIIIVAIILIFGIINFASAKTQLNNEQIAVIVYVLETFNVDKQDIKDIINILKSDNKEMKNIKTTPIKKDPKSSHQSA